MSRKYVSLFIVSLGVGVSSAEASCGAAFCAVNTQWNSQGVWTEPGWRADMRYEFVPQDQPRAGSNAVGVGQIPAHHDEIKTYNRNLLATLDYGSASGWGITASVPVIDRGHAHIHNHMGGAFFDEWNFREVGDVQLLGRYQFNGWNEPYVYGVYFGTKLPTGKFDVANDAGDRAERTLQPGTGTTDALLGLYARRNFPELSSSVFAQTLVQLPLNTRDGFKPGEKLSIDVGYRYDATERLSLLMQMNSHYKWRDSGAEAEPDDSGGYAVLLSPGASYRVTDRMQVYGLVQKPIYQYVNGVQLTADWSAVTGVSLHF